VLRKYNVVSMNHAKDGVQVPTVAVGRGHSVRRSRVGNAAVMGAGSRKTVRLSGGKGATGYSGGRSGGLGNLGVRMAGSVR
jgi:hypothetical protein